MEIFKNKFVTIDLDVQRALAHAVWETSTATMSNEEYKETFSKIGDAYIHHGVKYWLGDARNFLKPVTPILQTWAAEELNPKLLTAGLEKMALVLPSDFIASLSIEQSVDDMQDRNPYDFQTKYFDNIEEAQNWLLG